MNDFAGRVAVITGAASGMGRAFAERFAREGAKIVMADVEAAALNRAVAELRATGVDVLGVQTDVSSLESVQELAGRALEAYGKVHLVFNNAGVEGYLDGPIWEATSKDWAWTFGVNFWGVVHGVRTFLPILLGQDEEGYVVNTSSATGLVRGGNMYGITKHAVRALSETMYTQLKQRQAKVGVSVLCPGVVNTRIFEGSRNRPPELQNEQPTSGVEAGAAMRRAMVERMSQQKPAAEVADIVLQAIREERFYITTDHEWDARIASFVDGLTHGTNPPLGSGPAR
ncbi:MAG: SDR family NAD(P)-dependent oxidoreductase [Chloroflexota bacterium]